MNQEDLFETIYQTYPDFYVQCRNVEIDMLFELHVALLRQIKE